MAELDNRQFWIKICLMTAENPDLVEVEMFGEGNAPKVVEKIPLAEAQADCSHSSDLLGSWYCLWGANSPVPCDLTKDGCRRGKPILFKSETKQH